MSKLADKIRKVTRVESQPIGFGTSRASSSATMLIAGVARDAASVAEMARRGADIVIIGAADAAAPAAGEWRGRRTRRRLDRRSCRQ